MSCSCSARAISGAASREAEEEEGPEEEEEERELKAIERAGEKAETEARARESNQKRVINAYKRLLITERLDPQCVRTGVLWFKLNKV
jgi:hypothetical protein